MSFRTWVTIITVVLLALVVFFGWHEIVRAFGLLGRINLWVFALIVPVQLFSYYATGSMPFSYLRSKGNLKDMSRWRMARVTLELNFVNHILPSGGAAGFSYLGWVLSRFGVTAGRSTIAQIIRFVLTFITFILILIIAVIVLTLDHRINHVVIILSAVLTLLAVGVTTATIYIIGNQDRLNRFSVWLTRKANGIVSKLTRSRKKDVVKQAVLQKFFGQLNEDYVAIRADKRILIRPFIWSIFALLADVSLIFIAFLSLGVYVNPATLFVAFGVSSITSILSVAPGGAGIYEAVMIAFLASADVPADAAIAGTLLARVTLVLGTVIFGYIFYQLTIVKYGKHSLKR
jgi:uncharacterized protein (TIRG00374 family)